MKRLFTLLAMLCMGIGALCAQPADTDVSVIDCTTDSAQIARLSAQVARLEKRADRWDKVTSRMPKVSGYLQAGYEGATGSSTFLVKSVRVWATGNFASKLDYQLQVELVSPRLLDAYIRYKPLNGLNFQIGEFKVPFTIENTEYTPLRFEFIDYPLGLMNLCGYRDLSGIAASGREVGAMIYGGFFKREGRNILNYELGVFNGEGINLVDKNKSKDIAARLMIRPIDGLLITGYYYWGETGARYLTRMRYGGGACYDKGLFVARAEYIGGTTGRLSADESACLDFDNESWYVVGGVRPTKGVMIAARYDTLVKDRAVSASRQTNYTLGLTWEPVKYLRCQLNYTYEDFSAGSEFNRNVVALMFTGIF